MELLIDGQHHYATAQLPKKWTTVSPGTASGTDPCVWTIAAEGRTANCVKCTWANISNAQSGYLAAAPLMTNYGPWSPKTSGVCGFAIKVSDLALINTSGLKTRQFFSFYEGDGRVFYVKLNTNGTFSCFYHTESALLSGYVGSSVQGLRSNTWAYVEFKWTIADDPDGQFQIWLNGVKIYDMQTQTEVVEKKTNAGFSGSSTYSGVWNAVRILQIPSTTTAMVVRMCDFYLSDQETHSTDYVIADVVGDSTIGAIYPEGVGTYDEWTPLSGDNWANVDEHPPDDDTTYVSGSAGGIRDRYQMQDVPAGAVILGYQSLIYAKKESEGASILDPVLRLGVTDYVFDGQGVTSPDDYYYIIQPHDNNPATGAQATESDINGMEAGFNKE